MKKKIERQRQVDRQACSQNTQNAKRKPRSQTETDQARPNEIESKPKQCEEGQNVPKLTQTIQNKHKKVQKSPKKPNGAVLQRRPLSGADIRVEPQY